MNTEMAYLLGMICGNGEIKRSNINTTVSVDIPHKKLETENFNDVKVYVKASVTDIRAILEPLIGAEMQFIQQKSSSVLSFTKPNADYLVRQILRYTGNGTTHETIRLDSAVFSATANERRAFLRGFADVTGYIRRSNYFFQKYKHRVYIEVPHNWGLAIDVCNMLKSLDIPVQTIDWAHPNMRDGDLTKYNSGSPDFWKKEHQIKIWANEFEPIGFGIIHKRESLASFANELRNGFKIHGYIAFDATHKFYWELRDIHKNRPHHPSESDESIPASIRGKHYNSWREIANDLGYGE
ncbi:MAG: hypothetical protein LBJ14_07400 [Desulfarculales bacterium]|jgi:hypothetical protein|nr:hypothetical protein [Desulfarculales bacterium]